MGFFKNIADTLRGNRVDYQELIAQGAIVVDVRSPREFSNGHAPGSKNIPLQSLPDKLKSLKGKEIILVCRSGMRAGKAKSILQNNGITAHNAGGWQKVL